jgi:hypothetical protein
VGTDRDGGFVPDGTRELSASPGADGGGRGRPGRRPLGPRVLRDWERTVPVEQLVGERVLRAQVLERTGRVLTASDGEPVESRTTVTFAVGPPTGVRFVDAPTRARRDKPLTVRATSDLTAVGVKEVLLLPRQAGGRRAAEGGRPGPRPAVETTPGVWQAPIPFGESKGLTDIGVQFVPNAGRPRGHVGRGGRAGSGRLRQAGAGPDPGPGRGRDPRPPGLEVALVDAAKAVKGTAKTQANGSFLFEDVAPGKYTLGVVKESTGREGTADVIVKPGKPETPTIELLLGRPKP